MKPIETAYINALLADASYVTPSVNKRIKRVK